MARADCDVAPMAKQQPSKVGHAGPIHQARIVNEKMSTKAKARTNVRAFVNSGDEGRPEGQAEGARIPGGGEALPDSSEKTRDPLQGQAASRVGGFGR